MKIGDTVEAAEELESQLCENENSEMEAVRSQNAMQLKNADEEYAAALSDMRANVARQARALGFQGDRDINDLISSEAHDARAIGPMCARWNRQDRLRYNMLVQQCKAHARNRDFFNERIRIEFPEKTQREIEAYSSFWELKRMFREKRRACTRSWDARRKSIARSSARLLMETAKKVHMRQQVSCNREKHEQSRKRWHARLAIQKKVHAKRQALIDAMEEDQARERAEEEAAREAWNASLHARKRELVQQYKREQAMLKAVERLREKKENDAMRESKMKLGERNMVRVKFRKEKWESKVQSLKQKEEGKVRALEARQARLEKLASQAPYAEKLLDIKPSAERLYAERLQPADPNYKNYSAGGLFPRSGFSAEQICSDIRFKLMESLRASGLHQTNYAKSLIVKMGHQATRGRNISTVLPTASTMMYRG